jgi:hypothetical protein
MRGRSLNSFVQNSNTEVLEGNGSKFSEYRKVMMKSLIVYYYEKFLHHNLRDKTVYCNNLFAANLRPYRKPRDRKQPMEIIHLPKRMGFIDQHVRFGRHAAER